MTMDDSFQHETVVEHFIEDITERSLFDLSADLSAGRISSAALVQHYLQRIDRLDRNGPRLNSVIELNPEALAIARACDAARRSGQPCGPLHGVPLLIKDNIDTHDAMATTAGSMALVGARPMQDAVIVQRLRAAGAVLLGKTNLSEWANFRGSRSSGGWSARGGLTRNPYAPDRSASGSSSGSAAAVAASLCAAAVGTETDGSILSPAAVCGIVGMKPTVGLLSRSGIIPIAHSQDTPGPMARSVRDCALLLDAMLGASSDPEDAATALNPSPGITGYAGGLDSQTLRGARLGVLRYFFTAQAGVAAAYAPALAALEQAGAILIDPVELPDLATLRDAEKTVLLYEMKANLNAYLRRLGPAAPVRSLSDVIAFNKRHAKVELAWFGQDYFELAQDKGPLSSPDYLVARATCARLARDEGIHGLLAGHKLDALIAPTVGPAWAVDLLLGDHALPSSCCLAAVAGTPSITVPAALWQGLPLGLSWMGAAWSEQRLLNLAYAFEQHTQARRAPSLLPSSAE